MEALSLIGPQNDSSTGKRMNPFDMPKTIIPNHSLKKDLKIYVSPGRSTKIAKKVENPPWKTLEPIFYSAILALYCLILLLVSYLAS